MTLAIITSKTCTQTNSKKHQNEKRFSNLEIKISIKLMDEYGMQFSIVKYNIYMYYFSLLVVLNSNANCITFWDKIQNFCLVTFSVVLLYYTIY